MKYGGNREWDRLEWIISGPGQIEKKIDYRLLRARG